MSTLSDFLTKGWQTVLDVYGSCLVAWVTIAIVALSKFGINLKDRVSRMISYPKFNTHMEFVVEIVCVVDYVLNCIPPSYQHGDVNFIFSYEI